MCDCPRNGSAFFPPTHYFGLRHFGPSFSISCTRVLKSRHDQTSPLHSQLSSIFFLLYALYTFFRFFSFFYSPQHGFLSRLIANIPLARFPFRLDSLYQKSELPRKVPKHLLFEGLLTGKIRVCYCARLVQINAYLPFTYTYLAFECDLFNEIIILNTAHA